MKLVALCVRSINFRFFFITFISQRTRAHTHMQMCVCACISVLRLKFLEYVENRWKMFQIRQHKFSKVFQTNSVTFTHLPTYFTDTHTELRLTEQRSSTHQIYQKFNETCFVRIILVFAMYFPTLYPNFRFVSIDKMKNFSLFSYTCPRVWNLVCMPICLYFLLLHILCFAKFVIFHLESSVLSKVCAVCIRIVI